MYEFQIGDIVETDGGDFIFKGMIVATFRKRHGAVRYVVEDDRGILRIHSARTIKLLEKGK